MIDDPIVLILHEAAARGRQLRLAREQVARTATRSDGDAPNLRPSDSATSTTMTSQRGDEAVGKESSI